jgi:hypothetical protein
MARALAALGGCENPGKAAPGKGSRKSGSISISLGAGDEIEHASLNNNY